MYKEPLEITIFITDTFVCIRFGTLEKSIFGINIYILHICIQV